MFKIALSVLIIALIVSVAGCSKHRHHDPEKRAAYITKKIAKKLDLNEEQKEKLDAVRVEFLSSRKEFHRDREEMMDQLITQIKSTNLNEETINQLIQKRTTMFQQMSPKVVTKLAEFHATLNQEQKDKIVEKIQKYHNYKK